MDTNNKQVIIHVFANWNDITNGNLTELTSKALESKVPAQQKNSPQLEEESTEEEDGNKLYTVSQAAAYYQVSQNSIRTWIKKGLLPTIRINKILRIRKASILSLEKTRKGNQS